MILQIIKRTDIMKKIILSIFAIVLMTFTLSAQSGTSYGIKGGLNYNGNGDYFESIEANAKEPDKNVGYHIGVFGKIGDRLYFKPELVYTHTKSDYDNEDFVMNKIDSPLLVGLKLLGPVSVFGGPSLQYILNSKFDGVTIDDVENDFSVGLNFGIALNFNKIGIDLRYERGFSENEANFIQNNGLDIFQSSRLDTRPEQLILSLSLAL